MCQHSAIRRLRNMRVKSGRRLCQPQSNHHYSIFNSVSRLFAPLRIRMALTITSTSLWTYSLPAMSAYPNATYIPSTAAAPYANGTRMDCVNYVTAPVLTNYTGNGTTSFDCQDAVSQFGIEMTDFTTWNPSLSALSPCTMANNTQYCVQTYTQTSKNITSSCVQRDLAPPGYDCTGFTARRGIDQDQFILWNPEVGSNCEDFKVGIQYCVEVLHYQQPGITSNCNKFVAANNTNCK